MHKTKWYGEANIPEGKVYLEKNLFTYCFYDSKKLDDIHLSSHSNDQDNDQDFNVDVFSFKVEFLGVNKKAIKQGSVVLPEHHNYFNRYRKFPHQCLD